MGVENIAWGSVADWVSAVGTILAAAVALWLARRESRVKVSAYCGIRVMIDGEQHTRLVSITVTNTGFRSFKISNLGLTHGLIKKTQGIIKPGPPSAFRDAILQQVNDGDSSHFGYEIDADNWVKTVGAQFKTWLDVETFRVIICFSNGQVLKIKPERPLLQHFHAIRKARSRTDQQTAGKA